jgi:hypothetical protein
VNLELREKVVKKVSEAEPTHFDNSENRSKFEKLMGSLDYVSCFEGNVQLEISDKVCSPHFTTI